MLNVVNSLSIFNKVSQDRNIFYASVNNSLQKCQIKLGEFYDDPNSRENWQKWESIMGKSAKGDEKSCLDVQQLCPEIKDRCDDLPVEADLGTKILKPNEWKRSKFFK